MSKKGTYIGGHTLLVQRPSDFEAELERKAVSARKKADREQAAFDKRRAKKLAKGLARFHALNRAAEQAAADRRATSGRQTAEKIRRAPKSDVIVWRIRRKATPPSTPTRKQTGDD